MLDELRQKIHHHLIDELGPILYDKRLSEDDLRRRVHEQLHAALAQERAPLSAADKAQLIQDVSDDILGYGPIDRLLKDEDITEVMVNGPNSVYVERSGKLEKTDATLRRRDPPAPHHRQDRGPGRPAHRRVARRWCDARLPDGSRVNAVIHPLAIGGPFLTIRKFSKDPYQIDDLIRFGTLNAARRPASSRPAWSAGSTSSSPAVPAPVRRRRSTCCRRSSPPTSASSRSRTPRSSSSTRTTCSRWRPARRTSRARARSPSATS